VQSKVCSTNSLTTYVAVRAVSFLPALWVSAGGGCSFSAAQTNLPTTDGADVVDGSKIFDARPDAMVDTGPRFDVTGCPAGYLSVPGVSTARYRHGATNTKKTWNQAAGICSADSNHLTHLIVFDSQAEYDAVIPVMQRAFDLDESWTGEFIRLGQFSLPESKTVTDQARIRLRLSDVDLLKNENITVYPRAIFVHSDTFKYSNNPIAYQYNYICECDGRAGDARP
jgi:hypothetical protein